MKQFKTVFSFEFRNLVKNKIFIGVTLILVLVIAVVTFIPRFSGGNDESDPRGGKMNVFCKDGQIYQKVAAVFGEYFPGYEIIRAESEDELKNNVDSKEVDCGFVIDSFDSFRYVIKNKTLYESNEQIASEALTKLYRAELLAQSGLSGMDAEKILSARPIGETVILGEDQQSNFLYTYIMIMALYMVILLYGQSVATNVAIEKSSRAMELLVTSVDPVSMMFGKVLAACLTGFLQLGVVFGSAFAFYNVNAEYWTENAVIGSLFDIPGSLLVYLLVFFVLGFLVFAFLFGAVGSTVSKIEDINSAVMPVNLIFIAAFMVVIFSMTGSSVDSPLMKVCSFIPFTSPMAMFTRIAMSSPSNIEIAVSIAILAFSVVGIGYVSAKIYRVGVLMYGSKVKLTSLIKNLRKA